MLAILKDDKIGDMIYGRGKMGKRYPRYILGTDRNGKLKWLDYNLFINGTL